MSAPTVMFSQQNAPPMSVVQRRATVRYFDRMNPRRLYPLLVILSEGRIQEIVQKAVAQRASPLFDAATDTPLEIEPLLPGCECYPPRASIMIAPGMVTVKFAVAPQVLGRLPDPRILIRQHGKLIAEIPLEVLVQAETVTYMMAAATFIAPVFSAVLQHYGADLQSQIASGFGLYVRLLSMLAGRLASDLLFLGLLAASVLVYWWTRPRQRELFWEIAPTET